MEVMEVMEVNMEEEELDIVEMLGDTVEEVSRRQLKQR